MVNFKLRAIALLEAFSKAVPHSPFIAPQLGQLVKAAAAESKQSGSQAVSERLRGVIAKLCRSVPSASATNLSCVSRQLVVYSRASGLPVLTPCRCTTTLIERTFP